ncbi:hypothetical protein V8G54_006799 [Vigna mungo]|uniref:Uncharacterized protein n=1 Tax=Vigna mungo TaxID=3915 RepID=A0AAQ3P2U7_VIGMU
MTSQPLVSLLNLMNMLMLSLKALLLIMLLSSLSLKANLRFLLFLRLRLSYLLIPNFFLHRFITLMPHPVHPCGGARSVCNLGSGGRYDNFQSQICLKYDHMANVCFYQGETNFQLSNSLVL